MSSRNQFSKKLLRTHAIQVLLSWILAGYIRLVFLTSRKIYHIHNAAQIYTRGQSNGVFAFWHGRLMLMPQFYSSPRTLHALISMHRDGILISKVASWFGQQTISGSTSRGGIKAIRMILRVLKNGDNVSISPDGPRGPSQKASLGVVTIAKLSGKQVIPVAFSASRCKQLSSWDRFMLALPFGKIVFHIGAPITITRDMDDEYARVLIETAMNTLTDAADREAGHV